MTDVAGELGEGRFITEHDVYPLIFRPVLVLVTKRHSVFYILGAQGGFPGWPSGSKFKIN